MDWPLDQVQSDYAEKPFDLVSSIMKYEEGEMSSDEVLVLFSELLRCGMAWTLQGSYGRAAQALIDEGYLDYHGVILKDTEDE
jgi:hypothetical protein